MKNNKYSGNDIGEYPLTISEKVVVPSQRKRLNDVLADIFGGLEAVPGQIADAIAEALAPMEVTDITAMTDEQLDALQVGDKVAKVTGNQKHLYLVSYKGEGAGEGICLSYNAAGYGETVSYDRGESGWTYNSTDVKTYGE